MPGCIRVTKLVGSARDKAPTMNVRLWQGIWHSPLAPPPRPHSGLRPSATTSAICRQRQLLLPPRHQALC